MKRWKVAVTFNDGRTFCFDVEAGSSEDAADLAIELAQEEYGEIPVCHTNTEEIK